MVLKLVEIKKVEDACCVFQKVNNKMQIVTQLVIWHQFNLKRNLGFLGFDLRHWVKPHLTTWFSYFCMVLMMMKGEFITFKQPSALFFDIALQVQYLLTKQNTKY